MPSFVGPEVSDLVASAATYDRGSIVARHALRGDRRYDLDALAQPKKPTFSILRPM